MADTAIRVVCVQSRPFHISTRPSGKKQTRHAITMGGADHHAEAALASVPVELGAAPHPLAARARWDDLAGDLAARGGGGSVPGAASTSTP